MSTFDLNDSVRSRAVASGGRHAVVRRMAGHDRLAFWRPAALLSVLLLGAMLVASEHTRPQNPGPAVASFHSAPYGQPPRDTDGGDGYLASAPTGAPRLAFDGRIEDIAMHWGFATPPHAWIERVYTLPLSHWMQDGTPLPAVPARLHVLFGAALLTIAGASLMLGRRLGNFRLPAGG